MIKTIAKKFWNRLMPNTFGGKVIFLLTITQIIFLGSITYAGYYFINSSYQSELTKRVRSLTAQIHSSSKTAMISMDIGTLQAIARSAVELPDITKCEIFIKGVRVASVDSKNHTQEITHSKSIHHNIEVDGIKLGSVQFVMSLDEMEKTRVMSYTTFLALCFLEFIFALSIAIFSGRYIASRSEDLVQGIKRYSLGEEDFRYNAFSTDEFGIIAQSFNEMAAKISENNKNLELLRQQNINSNKMAALGEMASGIAHEINNPLTIISGYVNAILSLIRKNELTDEKLIKFLQKIESTSDRIAKIIRGLRTFSRNADKDLLESVELTKIIEDSLALCSEKLVFYRINLEIINELKTDLKINCRPTQISQVLINLISNAFDAIEDFPSPWIKIYLSANEQKVVIKFVDCGKGIPEDVLQKIMEPFFTTKQVGKGTGLGLSISKNIIEGHNGQFYYDRNELNTCFVIELPIYVESPCDFQETA